MELRRVVADEDAVSPVIGVILMVAITVVIGAVVGTFTLGLGEGISDTAPNARIDFQESSGSVPAGCSLGSDVKEMDLVHQGGDEVGADTVTLKDSDDTVDWGTCGSGSTITAGSSATVGAARDDTLRVVWTKGDETTTLAKWTGPDA